MRKPEVFTHFNFDKSILIQNFSVFIRWKCLENASIHNARIYHIILEANGLSYYFANFTLLYKLVKNR